MIGKASTQIGGPSLPIVSSATTSWSPASTDGSGTTSTSIRPRPRMRCPPSHGPCTSSCRGTRVCIAAPARSRATPRSVTSEARAAALGFAGRPQDGDDIAIVCRNTTEAINHLAYRLRLHPTTSS